MRAIEGYSVLAHAVAVGQQKTEVLQLGVQSVPIHQGKMGVKVLTQATQVQHLVVLVQTSASRRLRGSTGPVLNGQHVNDRFGGGAQGRHFSPREIPLGWNGGACEGLSHAQTREGDGGWLGARVCCVGPCLSRWRWREKSPHALE